MARGGLRSTSFKPGKSGNPGGRPKGVSTSVVADIRALAKTYGEDAIEALVSIMGNAKTPPAARVAAAIAVLDRGYGKPSQRMDMDMAGSPITLEALIMARIKPPPKTDSVSTPSGRILSQCKPAPRRSEPRPGGQASVVLVLPPSSAARARAYWSRK